MKIAIGAFQHETNTFAPTRASFAHFERGGGWPGLTRGGKIFETVAGMNIPIAGFIDAARPMGWELAPLSYAQASPSAQVTDDAFERIAGMLIEDLKGARGIDALFLDLHGAAVIESHEDGEGELLRRIRALVGPELPLVASLDLHANVTPEMMRHADLLVAYRTYPHVDMAETGARAALLLARLLRVGRKPHKAFRQIPFLIPGVWQCTLIEPAQAIYAGLEPRERDPILSLSFNAGFAPADIYHSAPSVLAFGWDQAATERAAEILARDVEAAEADFRGKVWEPREAVRHGLRVSDGRPVVLADTQDNPGAGTDSDTIGMLEALIAERAENSAMGLVADAETARIAHQAGEGAEITVKLGGKSNGRPFAGTFRVVKATDGGFTATGPFYGGSRMELGPMARLHIGGVDVVVASKKVQAADQAMFRHVGIEPGERRVLVLKSSVHFRADFQPIAAEVLVVAAPGANPIDHTTLPYKRLRPGMRLMPMGPEFRP
jgi:microcystin degradation protein MlrC